MKVINGFCRVREDLHNGVTLLHTLIAIESGEPQKSCARDINLKYSPFQRQQNFKSVYLKTQRYSSVCLCAGGYISMCGLRLSDRLSSMTGLLDDLLAGQRGEALAS